MASTLPDIELDTERWCAGLRCTGSAPLEDLERAFLDGTTHALLRRVIACTIGALLGLALPFAILIGVPKSLGPAWLDVSFAFVMLGAATVIPTWCVLRAYTAWRSRTRCLADLAHGEVQIFEGALEADDALDQEQRELLALGILIPQPGVAQRLRVIPECAAVIRRGGKRPGLMAVTIHEVAAAPAYAMRVPVPREQAFVDGAPDVHFLRRSLNPHERAELAFHIRRLRKPGVAAAIWGCAAAAWLAAAVLDPRGVLAYAHGAWGFLILQGLVLLVTLGGYLRSLRFAHGLERDTRTGWAFTLLRDVPQVAATGTDDAVVETAPDADPRRTVEFLPHSRALWIERGRPARWRNLRRAA